MNELKNQVSILHTIGKLDLISTEKCRKGFAKKNPNLYEPYEAQFVTNAAETLGWDVLEAHAIWKLLKDYSLHNIIGMIDVLVKSLNVPPEFFSYENMIESTKMKRDIYNLIKKLNINSLFFFYKIEKKKIKFNTTFDYNGNMLFIGKKVKIISGVYKNYNVIIKYI